MDSVSEMSQHSGDGGCEPPGCFPFYPGWGEGGGDEDAQDKCLRLCCPAGGAVYQDTPSCRLAFLEEQHHAAGCFLACPLTPPPAGPADTAPASPPSSGVPPPATRPVTDACVPFSLTCIPAASAWDTLTSSPGCSDGGPVSAAAHLHLLGESLSLIGAHLQETDKVLCVSGSLSLLLDSLLCAVAPLVGLTAQIPELRSCSQHNLAFTLENIAYLMPGL
ncbi:HMG box-containing protein 4-like [Betta splendens]|uniref:HMG box-containing protein 4-like n=1 Tax=Betta splendens TaxID=158456 RepID=A0A6P7NRH6_BETSP|nr:HMG box-containing protein 4-like [Betta splendens]XP_029020129.1 HMG box-containing protein 4-like [Betta splendens]